jgi:hypothetical protein
VLAFFVPQEDGPPTQAVFSANGTLTSWIVVDIAAESDLVDGVV